METKAKSLTRQEKSASRQQKLKHQKKIIFWILLAILIISLGSLGGWVYANKATTHQINQQYKTVDQQRYLKTTVSKQTAQTIITKQARWHWLFSAATAKQAADFIADYQARTKRTQAIAALMDGTHYYRDTVTGQQLTHLDQTLLKEKNPTVYQKAKNKLDTVQVWYAQTTDGSTFINDTYYTFQHEKDQLTQEQVSEANVYYKLLKNRRTKAKWRQPIEKMTAGYSALQKEKNESQAQADQKALEDLKNSALTQSYTPAKVTIEDSRTSSSRQTSGTTTDSDTLTDALADLNITASRVLVLDTANDMLFIAQRSNGTYRVSGSQYTVLANSLSTGAYRIRALIQNSSTNAGVITSGSDFGTYFTTPPAAYADETNTETDFNEADPVFWLKNQPALNNSILVTSGQSLGFITSGNISSENIIRVSSTTLTNLLNTVSQSMTLGVI